MILVSGGFDPVHTGHLDLLEDASKYGSITIALNSDKWLMKKKGFVFMPWEDRYRILMALLIVDEVTHVYDEDGTVCEALRRLKPTHFANGGDRINAHPAEDRACIDMDITQVFCIGGVKTRSSSKFVEAVR